MHSERRIQPSTWRARATRRSRGAAGPASRPGWAPTSTPTARPAATPWSRRQNPNAVSGVAKDEAEAVRWFRKAADQGDARGQQLAWIPTGGNLPDKTRDKESVSYGLSGRPRVSCVSLFPSLHGGLAQL